SVSPEDPANSVPVYHHSSKSNDSQVIANLKTEIFEPRQHVMCDPGIATNILGQNNPDLNELAKMAQQVVQTVMGAGAEFVGQVLSPDIAPSIPVCTGFNPDADVARLPTPFDLKN